MPDINSIFDSSISSEESSSEISTKIKAKMLRIMIFNFQGIWSKKELFENFLLYSRADVVTRSETFLDPSIKNAKFHPPDLTAYRWDCDDGWGGVIIITESSLVTDVVFTSTQTECISIKIETHHKPVISCSAYRPPNNDIEYLKLLAKYISSIQRKFSKNNIWIGGDMNLPDINWESNIISSHQYNKELDE